MNYRHRAIGRQAVGMACLAVFVSTTLFASMTACGGQPEDEQAKKDRRQLVGTWQIVELTVNGKASDAADLKKLAVVHRADGTWSLRTEDREVVRGKSTLQPAAKPKAIDFSATDERGKTTQHLGIYAIEGETRKLCFAPSDKDRPAEFRSKPGSEHILVLFRRQPKE